MSKKLYIVISDGGDGSQSLNYTFDKSVIDRLEELEQDGELDDCWQSGDGVQISTLELPDECTYKSLGIYNPLTEDYL